MHPRACDHTAATRRGTPTGGPARRDRRRVGEGGGGVTRGKREGPLRRGAPGIAIGRRRPTRGLAARLDSADAHTSAAAPSAAARRLRRPAIASTRRGQPDREPVGHRRQPFDRPEPRGTTQRYGDRRRLVADAETTDGAAQDPFFAVAFLFFTFADFAGIWPPTGSDSPAPTPTRTDNPLIGGHAETRWQFCVRPRWEGGNSTASTSTVNDES